MIVISPIQRVGFAFGLIGACLFIALVVAASIFGDFEVQKEVESVPYMDQDNSNMAQVMSKDFVKEILVAPSSAKFPGLFQRQAKVTILSPRKYKVVWRVDSMNLLGVHVRSQYSIVMTQTSDNDWSASNFFFDGEKIY